MLGRITVIQEDHKAIFVKLERSADFKINEVVNITKAKKKRTLKQNALYWCFLTWCIHPKGGDMRSQGWFSVDGLHTNIKAWIEENHAHDFPMDRHFTTTELTVEEFHSFFELVNQELFVEFLGIDTSGFWRDHEQYSQWVDYNSADFKAYMDEQYSTNVPF